MNLLEEIQKNAGLNEMTMEDFRGPAGLEKAKSTIVSVFKNFSAGKVPKMDYTGIIESARKALVDSDSVRNKKYIDQASKVLGMIKSKKSKLGSQQARMETK